MKTYEVVVKCWATVVVLASSESAATSRALDVVDLGDCQMDEAGPARQVKGEERASCLRHADAVDYDLEDAKQRVLGRTPRKGAA